MTSTSNQDALALAKALVARRSPTPDDGGRQALIGERLQRAGFTLEPMRFGDVDNLWARRGGTRPVICFAGHTDVVPTGPESKKAFLISGEITDALSDRYAPML